MTGTGSPNVFTTTAGPGGAAGVYALTGFGAGSYTVSLSKTTGQNGISSNDAARIAQHVAGLLQLTTNIQKVTADVSNNGSVSSTDAAQIARFVAATGPPTGLTNQWKFFVPPGPTFPVGASATTRTYESVTSNITGQDFTGLLIGEVTGNWVPGPVRPANKGGRSTTVTVPRLVTPTDSEITIPVSVKGAANRGIISYEFDLRYDPAVIQPQLEPVNVAGTASRGLFSIANTSEPGLLRVVLYGPMPIDGKEILLYLKFRAIGYAGAVSPLTFERIMFNEGDPAALTTAGQVELSTSSADQAEISGQLLNQMGQGIPMARVTLADTTGRTHSMISNGFGYYRFSGLQFGQTYTISAESRGRTFAPLTVSVTDKMLSVHLISEH